MVELTTKQKRIIALLFLVLLVIILIVIFLSKHNKQKNNFELQDKTTVNQNKISNKFEDKVKLPSIEEKYPNDKDRDGLNSEEEKKYGTSDYNPDTDGDGLSDKDEIEKYKTQPTNPDTDGDGYWDGLEVYNNYDPLKK